MPRGGQERLTPLSGKGTDGRQLVDEPPVQGFVAGHLPLLPLPLSPPLVGPTKVPCLSLSLLLSRSSPPVPCLPISLLGLQRCSLKPDDRSAATASELEFATGCGASGRLNRSGVGGSGAPAPVRVPASAVQPTACEVNVRVAIRSFDATDSNASPQAIRVRTGDAMTDFSEKLSALMAERQLSQCKLAKLVPCNDGYVSRIARGLRNPSIELAERFDELLEADGALVALAPPPKPRQSSQGQISATAATVGHGTHPGLWNNDVKRRAALQIIGALGAGAAIPAGALEEVFADVERATGERVDIDEWEMTVREYATLKMRQPVGSLINDLTADIIRVGRTLERGLAEPKHTGLLRVSAALSALLAVDFGDIGHRRAARTAWSAARHAADAADDRELRVYVRASQAMDALWAEMPDDHVTGLAI